MDKVDKYIDDLFHQKFSGAGATIPPSGGDWLQMSKVIRKKNFLRFSPGSFNVFYLTAAAAAVATVCSFVLPDMFRHDQNETVNTSSTIQLIDSLPKTDTLTESDDSAFTLKSEPSKTICSGQNPGGQLMNASPADNSVPQPTKETNDVANHEDASNQSDSLNISTNNIRSLENGDRISGKNTQTDILPADTILQIDTVRIQKKTVQFKRKKEGF